MTKYTEDELKRLKDELKKDSQKILGLSVLSFKIITTVSNFTYGTHW